MRSRFQTHPAASACLLLCALVAACAFTTPALAQDDMTLDELVAKNLEARGGDDAWDAVQSAKVEAHMVLPGDQKAPMVFYFAEPDKMRTEIDIQGNRMIQAYDGEVGWQILPLFGSQAAQRLGDDELKQMLRQDFFRGLLQSYEEKGYEAEYLGTETIDGKTAHEVRIDFEPGAEGDDADDVLVYLDADTHLEIQQVIDTVNPQTGSSLRVQVKADDFRPAGDLVVAHRYELVPEGVPQGQTIVIDSIELNPPEIDDALFAMPAPPAAEGTDAETGNDGAGGR